MEQGGPKPSGSSATGMAARSHEGRLRGAAREAFTRQDRGSMCVCGSSPPSLSSLDPVWPPGKGLGWAWRTCEHSGLSWPSGARRPHLGPSSPRGRGQRGRDEGSPWWRPSSLCRRTWILPLAADAQGCAGCSGVAAAVALPAKHPCPRQWVRPAVHGLTPSLSRRACSERRSRSSARVQDSSSASPSVSGCRLLARAALALQAGELRLLGGEAAAGAARPARFHRSVHTASLGSAQSQCASSDPPLGPPHPSHCVWGSLLCGAARPYPAPR